MTKYKGITLLTIGAITVTTTLSNAIATPYLVIDSTEEQKITELKKEIYKFFNTKYTSNKSLISNSNNLGKTAYKIQISDNLETIDSSPYLTSYAEFEKNFNQKYSNLTYTQKIIVKYSTISRTLSNGELVDYKQQKYTGNEKEVIWKTLEDGTKQGKIIISPDTTTQEPRFIYVKIGDTLLDINKPIFRQKNGYYIDSNGYTIKKVDNNIIETIQTLPNGVIDGCYEDTKISLGEEDKIQNTDAIVKYADIINTQKLTVEDIYEPNTGRLTIKGNELLKSLQNNNYLISLEGTNKITDEPSKLYIDKSDNNNIVLRYINNNIEVNTQDLSSMNIIIEEKTTDNKHIINKLIIKPTRKAGLDTLVKLLIENPPIQTHAGLNRYETAVQVSKVAYKQTTDNVILVSGESQSLVDGLTSTPLAASLNAPILLTKKDEIPKETIEEIERLKAKNIYIIGGESVISQKVYNKLDRYYGKNIKRIYGKDRYETSIAVADELVKNKKQKLDTFIVGGNGQADALSISSLAASKQSPIILTPKENLSYDARYFLHENTSKAYIIGGTNIVANTVAQDILNLNLSVKRIEGERRQDTNAAVIKEFYTNGKELYNNGGIIISKSTDEGLVDSLAAGILGDKINAPIVLATDSLTYDQEDVLTELKSKDNKLQVGYGVSSKVAEYIYKLK
ncbi:cell wall-binding repeat-containing protein [Romboutsia sp.]|uniref:cell wall-binding repeat-containing protein n=1 Tax=Romboutsia sp. TaxID=1965302 RepID=UPI003F37E3E4